MDYYQILGVSKDANPDDIKKAYRKLASIHHPDRGGDTAKFQQVQQAYDVLSDPEKRKHYDQPKQQFNNGNFNFGFSMNGSPFEDFVSQFFRQAQSNQPRRQIYRTVITIELEQSYFGGTQTLKIQTPNEIKTIEVTIPKGVHHGSQVRLDNIIKDATLLVEFNIIKHLKFDRVNDDLVSNVSISVLDLIVGSTIEFVTLSGKTLEVTIPAKTQPYMHIKMAGQGMPVYNSDMFGDQILLLKPYIPDTIDETVVQSILSTKNKEK